MAIPKYCIKDSAKFIDIDKHINNFTSCPFRFRFRVGRYLLGQIDQIEGIDIKKDPENALTYSFDLDKRIKSPLLPPIFCKMQNGLQDCRINFLGQQNFALFTDDCRNGRHNFQRFPVLATCITFQNDEPLGISAKFWHN